MRKGRNRLSSLRSVISDKELTATHCPTMTFLNSMFIILEMGLLDALWNLLFFLGTINLIIDV